MIRRFALLAACLAMGLGFMPFASAAAQRTFATAQAAAAALHDAARSGDRAALSALLGPAGAEAMASGDGDEDLMARERFVAAYDRAMRIEPLGKRRAEIVVGTEEWHFPFPLVREGERWRFDALAGRAEVAARRIGRNELAAMQAVLAFVDAQREYATQRHDGEGPGAYARRINSSPGRHDGLYWQPSRDYPLSPLGVRFTLAAADETTNGGGQPYHGYYFRMLFAQGPHAAGGAAEYLVDGRMLGGFALVAWPARYRVTGVRTFIVSHHGLVFSRDLGVRTTGLVAAMRSFDPGPGWVQEIASRALPEPGDRMQRVVGERGCTLCHRDAPAPREGMGMIPLAPSWREIAARYRDRADAEQYLTRIVIEGADPADRHWKDRHEFTEMGANAGRVSPDEARAIVRWILQTGVGF